MNERLTTEDIAAMGSGSTAMISRPEATGGTARVLEAERPAPLLGGDEAQQMRNRWTDIQAAFVDEPRHAVEEADGLVAEAIKRLAEVFSDERQKLEGQWDRGDQVSTEDLRQALRRYRSFFERLLAM